MGGRIGVVACLLFGCGPSRGPAKAPEVDLTPLHILTPAGVSLATACTPTGPELCFNAIDDNCNGIIDEGCGVGTGLLQFTLAWSEPDADVDLVVTDPAGNRVSEANRSVVSGLRLDRDCPGEGCNGQNVENVFYEGEDPLRGHYGVQVKLTHPHQAPLPLHVRFAARIGRRVYSTEIVLEREGDQKDFAFEL